MIRLIELFQRHGRVTSGVLAAHLLALAWAAHHLGAPPPPPEIPIDVQAIQLLAPQPQIHAAPRKPNKPPPKEQPRNPQPATKVIESTPTETPQATAPEAPAVPAAAQVAEVPQTSAVVLPSSRLHQDYNPRPPYPALSKRLGEQGQVLVRVWVNANGEVSEGSVKTSSGFDRLDAIALRTVLRWRFTPGSIGGVQQAMWVNVPVRFVLK
jgi:protein TonB